LELRDEAAKTLRDAASRRGTRQKGQKLSLKLISKEKECLREAGVWMSRVISTIYPFHRAD
jgi:hypothetical protein